MRKQKNHSHQLIIDLQTHRIHTHTHTHEKNIYIKTRQKHILTLRKSSQSKLLEQVSHFNFFTSLSPSIIA